MAKNDRRQIAERIDDYPDIQYNDIESIIRQFTEVQEKYGDLYENIVLDTYNQPYSDSVSFCLTGYRLENDDEYKQRKAIEKYNRQLAEQKEKEAYLALKQKYDGKYWCIIYTLLNNSAGEDHRKSEDITAGFIIGGLRWQDGFPPLYHNHIECALIGYQY